MKYYSDSDEDYVDNYDSSVVSIFLELFKETYMSTFL